MRRSDRGEIPIIEVIVILCIIGTIIAVAIPTYLSARDRAKTRQVEEQLPRADSPGVKLCRVDVDGVSCVVARSAEAGEYGFVPVALSCDWGPR